MAIIMDEREFREELCRNRHLGLLIYHNLFKFINLSTGECDWLMAIFSLIAKLPVDYPLESEKTLDDEL